MNLFLNMDNMNHIAAELKAAMARHEITQEVLAKRSGLAKAQFSRLLNNGFQTISAELLQAVASGWPDSFTGQVILEAHLKDEIIRSGHSLDEYELSIKGEAQGPGFNEYLAAIQKTMDGEPALREVIEYFGKSALSDLEAKKGKRP